MALSPDQYDELRIMLDDLSGRLHSHEGRVWTTFVALLTVAEIMWEENQRGAER